MTTKKIVFKLVALAKRAQKKIREEAADNDDDGHSINTTITHSTASSATIDYEFEAITLEQQMLENMSPEDPYEDEAEEGMDNAFESCI